MLEGDAVAHIWHFMAGELAEIDTPDAALVMQAAGVYRADVATDAATLDTQFVVRRGGQAQVLGQRARIELPSEALAHLGEAVLWPPALSPASSLDCLDVWAENRDQAEQRPQSLNFVGRDLAGFEDLDAFGQWTHDAAAGSTW